MELFRVLMLVILITAFAPAATATSVRAPDPCIVNAYVPSPSGDHISQVGNGTIQFGTMLFVETDCGEYDISFDGGPPTTVLENQILITNVSTSLRQIHIEGDGWNMTYINLQFWPANMYSEMMVSYQENIDSVEGDYWTVSDMRSRDFMVGLVTVIIALVISLAVVNRVARHVVERQVGREITEGYA